MIIYDEIWKKGKPISIHYILNKWKQFERQLVVLIRGSVMGAKLDTQKWQDMF